MLRRRSCCVGSLLEQAARTDLADLKEVTTRALVRVGLQLLIPLHVLNLNLLSTGVSRLQGHILG